MYNRDSNEMFKISRIVVHKILRGDVKSPREALAAFNEELKKDTIKEPVVATLDQAFSNEFTPEHGNRAASRQLLIWATWVRLPLTMCPTS